jgi:hypothetical protein
MEKSKQEQFQEVASRAQFFWDTIDFYDSIDGDAIEKELLGFINSPNLFSQLCVATIRMWGKVHDEKTIEQTMQLLSQIARILEKNAEVKP